MTQDESYRADIDGLRALAVLSVVFFHVGIGGFGGGFIGVDVCFVIGGFAITRSIRNEVLRTGSFRFAEFYLRRGQRLLPALFFTFVATFSIAVLLFSPADLQRLGGVLVYSVAGVSNFFFWTEGDYFEAVSNFWPLVHTWSIAVAAQLYLVWPVGLVFLLRRTPRFTLPILAAVALLSLLLNLEFADGGIALLTAIGPRTADWFSDGAATIFYLAPFRIFEFAIGAGVVWARDWPQPHRILAEVLAPTGLLLIAGSIFAYAEGTAIPSVYALLPCAGTALVLYAGTTRWTTRWLGGRLGKLGRISYSLYLVHWPLIAFLRYATQYEPNVAVGTLITIASVLVAALMYRWVEKPFQRPAGTWSPGAFGFSSAVFALGISLVSASTWANQGWPWRFGQGDTARAFGEVEVLSRERKQYLNQHVASYFSTPDRTKDLLVVGDSLADDLVIGLAENLDLRFEVQADRYLARCRGIFSEKGEPTDDECSEILAGLDFSLKVRNADEIYIAFQPDPTVGLDELAPLVGFLRERAKPDVRIVLFGVGPRFPKFQAAAVRLLAGGASLEEVEKTARRLHDVSPGLDPRMKAAADPLGIEFMSRFDILCSDERCKFFTEDDSLMFFDPLHLTVRGARWYGEGVARSLFGEEVLEVPERMAGGSEALIEAYSGLLGSKPIDGQTVFDVAQLPDSKDRIRRVLSRALLTSSDPADREALKTGLFALAFFQPDVGEEGAPIDSAGPGEGMWRDVVEADMKAMEQALVDEGDAP